MLILSVKEAAKIKLPSPVSQEYWENSEWAHEHINEISVKYPNQWVIIYKKKVVAASTSGSKAKHIATEKVGNQEFVILFAEKGMRVY